MERPVLVRMSGLPASGMDRFHSDLVSARLQARWALEERTSALRSSLVDAVFARIEGAPDDHRRFLLGVKRDAFNGRPLARYLDKPLWHLVEAAAGDTVRELLDAEAEIERRRHDDTLAYQATLFDQRRVLVERLSEGTWTRGVALASPVLARQASRLARRDVERWRSKERRAQLGVARYVSRTALKTSPYSTLTVLGYGELADEGAMRFTAPSSEWRQHALLRTQRFMVDQMVQAVEQYGPWRDRCRLRFNPTVTEVEPGKCRLLRPGLWALDDETKRLKYQQMASVQLGLKTELVETLRHELADQPTWREWIDVRTAAHDGDRDAALHEAGRLAFVGVVELLRPWPTSVDHIEPRLLAALRALPDPEPRLTRACAELADWVDAERAFSRASPDQVADAIERLEKGLDTVWEAFVELSEWPAGTEMSRFRDGHFFEDVFVTPNSVEAPLLRIPTGSAMRAQQAARGLLTLAHLFDPTLEWRLALGEHIRRADPDRDGLPVLDLFADAQTLWRSFRKWKRQNTGEAPYDPFDLPAIQQLTEVRERVADQIRAAKHTIGQDEEALPQDALDAALEEIPHCFCPDVGTSSFLLPLDKDGSRWVAHWIHEGTGRFGSRYSSCQPETLRTAYTEHVRRASRARGADGESIELLDLLACRFNNLNIHDPQTERLLETPGEQSDLPAERRLDLSRLRVRVDESGFPRLIDPDGQRLVPAHLGGLDHRLLPVVLKFLTDLDGTGNLKGLIPGVTTRRDGDVLVTSRLHVGDLVARRQRWVVETAALIESLDGLDDAAAFEEVNRWRLARSLPDRVFLIEKLFDGDGRPSFKPQFVDFTSPVYVAVFRNALHANSERMDVEEMLPAPESHPTDADGAGWTVELILDDGVLGESTHLSRTGSTSTAQMAASANSPT